MGCDIHGWVEKRVGDKWIGYKELTDRTRNYNRFAAIAGVRGEGPEPRGVPDDVSETVSLHIDERGNDGHSHSWLPLKDAYRAFEENRFIGPNNFYSEYSAFEIEIDDESDWAQYRLVFWFDN